MVGGKEVLYDGLNVNGNVTSANRGQEESSKF